MSKNQFGGAYYHLVDSLIVCKDFKVSDKIGGACNHFKDSLIICRSLNVSDKIGGAYDHLAHSLIISGEKISVFGEIRYLLLVTKLGERTIILHIHSSYPAKKYRFSAKSGTYC